MTMEVAVLVRHFVDFLNPYRQILNRRTSSRSKMEAMFLRNVDSFPTDYVALYQTDVRSSNSESSITYKPNSYKEIVFRMSKSHTAVTVLSDYTRRFCITHASEYISYAFTICCKVTKFVVQSLRRVEQ
jgi:hypothetical protein